MRLYVIFLISFIFIASLVGVVGYWVGRTGDQILSDVEELRATSLVEAEAAAGMTTALQASQISAHEVIAARYRKLTDPTAWPVGQADHEWELDAETEIFISDMKANLDVLREALESGRAVTLSALEFARQEGGGLHRRMPASQIEDLLGEVSKVFTEYDRLIEEFIHQARYHPSNEVSEFVTDQLEVHYKESMLPNIQRYADYAQQGLDEELTVMQSAFSAANRRNLGLTAAALVGAILLGLLIARSISRPLDQLRFALDRFGSGELDTRVELDTRTEIGFLADAFNQTAATLEATTVSRSYLENIIQSMDEMLIVAGGDGRIETVNRKALETLGYEEHELIGRPASVLLDRTCADDIQAVDDCSGADTVVKSTEPSPVSITEGDHRFATKSGAAILVNVSSAALGQGVEGAVVYLAQDITDRKRAERELHASLEEKEVLLKEVHHRVKNNLQVISSLMRLQGVDTNNRETMHAFRESQNRIRSMALIHEQLYRSEDLAHIHFAEYVERLVNQVRGSYVDQSGQVEVVLDVDETTLHVDDAILYGMIINELLSNALEHAFAGRESGRVTVTFWATNGRHRLEVHDNGSGMPSNLDAQETGSLGLRLVHELVGQLKGALHVDSSDGTRVTVSPAPSSLTPDSIAGGEGPANRDH